MPSPATSLRPGAARDAARALLDERISRRAFLSCLGLAGVCAPAARALARSLAATGPGLPAGRVVENLTGGELMAEILRAWNLRYVFGLGGSEEVGFLDALADRVDLQYVLGLHEGSVMAMADGYARTSGETPLVNLHSVAGASYALGPMVNAFKDRTPVVVTVGRQSTDLRGSNAFLEAPDLHTLPRDYTRWNWDLLRADAIPDTLRRAFLLARMPPGGPTFLTFSKDLWETTLEQATLPAPPRRNAAAEFVPSGEQVQRLADALAAARAPLIVAGRELARHGGVAALVEIAELLGAPVMSDVPASHSPMAFPTAHPLYAGMFGAEDGFPAEIDLFWSVGGTMFTLFSAPPGPLVPAGAVTAHLTVDLEQLERNRHVDIPLPGNTAATLPLVLEALRARGLPAEQVSARTTRVAGHHRRQRERLDAAARAVWDRAPIAPERLAVELNHALDPEAIVVTELATGDPFVWQYLDFMQGAAGRTHVTSAGGCLGWGLGAAIGAKIGAPERFVALLVGDGSFQFGVQALWTAARYEVPIAVIIWNNVAYQANRSALHRYGRRAAATGKYVGCYLGAPEIDNVRIAAGYGVEGEAVSDPGRLRAALARCLREVAAGRPRVLDVRLEPRFGGAGSTWYDAFSVARGEPRRS